MIRYLHKFDTNEERSQYENWGGGYVTPYTSLVYEDDSVHYNVFKAQLTLTNGRVITIPQKGNNSDSALTLSDVSAYKDSVVDVVVGNRIKTLGSGVFSGCTKLENIEIHDIVTTIYVSAFSNCISLTNISVPSNITTIYAYTFNGCSNLTNIEFNGKITHMARYAVFNCKSLTSVTIPNSIIGIEVGCFKGCSKLSSVTVLATTPPTLGTQVFDGNASGRKIYVPSDSVDAYKTATSWSRYASSIEPIPNE